MQATRSNLFALILIALLGVAAVTPLNAAPQRTRKHMAKATAQPAQPQIPAGPLKPLNLDEIPATPPQVSYANGQLTIVAQNSTLSDILNAVHRQTGAVVETPGNANERVVVHLGPGPARDVLATLLNGSHFDYVMLGSAENPTAVAHVILTAKSGGAAAENNPVQQANAAQQAPQQEQAEQDVTQDVGTDDFASADDEPQGDIPADQPAPADDQAQQQQQPQQFPNGQVMRSPEQLLQELQQRQLQQQQNGGAPTPAAPQGYPIPPDQQAPQPPQ